MNLAAKLGALTLTTAICFGGTALGSSADAAVSGFSIRNSYTGKCLNAPGYDAGLTVVTCNKNSAKQRWANVASEFQNRFPAGASRDRATNSARSSNPASAAPKRTGPSTHSMTTQGSRSRTQLAATSRKCPDPS
jgi:hypothetical protein